ncbi:MAG: zinc ribbon domain-containing protein [Phycisphaerales bacterium]|nr:zinc ribbon domain-containing protein [Phycisphaerales bacterium]
MALRRCKECGKEVSSKARACVGCGAPTKRQSSPLAKLVAWMLIGSVGLAIIASAVKQEDGVPSRASAQSSTTVEKPVRPKKSAVDAGIIFTGTQFVIENKNEYDWTNVRMIVNSGILSGGYALRVSRLAAGETYTVGAAQFTKSDGERFNPFSHKPRNFTIHCNEGLFTGG